MDKLIYIVLAGAKTATTPDRQTGLAMPAFAWKLGDSEFADLVNHIRNSWDNRSR